MIKGKKVDNTRKERERDLSDKNRFEILLEDMRHEFKAVGEGHGILLNEIRESSRESKERDKELEHMIMISNRSLTEEIRNVETKLGQRIDKVEQNVEVLKQDVGVLKQDVGVLKQDVKSIDNRLTNVEQKVDKIDTKLDKVVERQDKQEVRQDEQDAKIDEVYHKVFAERAGF